MNRTEYVRHSVASALGLGLDAVTPMPSEWGEHLRAVVIDRDNTRLWLKERPYYLKAEEFVAIREATLQLHRRGAPVPAPPVGRRPLLRVGGRIFLVEAYLGPSSIELALSPAAGAALAHFHAEAEFITTWRRSRHRRPLWGAINHSDTVYRLLRRLENIAFPTSDKRARREALGTLRWLDGILHARRYEAQPRPQWIHGDAAPENCILTQHTATLVDFDDSRWGEPEWDLAQYVLRSYTSAARIVRTTKEFFTAYLERRSISRARIIALAPLVVAGTLATDLDLMPRRSISAENWSQYRASVLDGTRLLAEVLQDSIPVS